MKKVIFMLGLAIFGTVTAQFSLADADDAADLIRQVTEMNSSKKTESDFNNSTDLTATTAYKPSDAPATVQTPGSAAVNENTAR